MSINIITLLKKGVTVAQKGVIFKHVSEHPLGVGSVAMETFDLLIKEQHLHETSICYYNFDTELVFSIA